MTKNTQNINLWFDRFDEKMDRVVPAVIAETAIEEYRESFRRQAWNGVPWQKLSDRYASSVRRSRGRILTRTGALQGSIRDILTSPELVIIGAGNSKVPYARVHQEGFRGVQYVRPYTKRNRGGQRRGQVKGHSKRQNIPRRQYMGMTRPLAERMRTRINLALST